MTVYVDTAFIEATVPNGRVRHNSKWCHLTADTKAELHEFAQRLGLRRSYFQDKPSGRWHYDVTEGMRWKAIRMGAVEIGCDAATFESVWRRPGREGASPQRLGSEPGSAPGDDGDRADRWARVMCTGHRDKYLSDDQYDWMHAELARVAAKLIERHGMRVALHGGANGADLAWARAADDAGVVDLWAYLPFPGQTKGWTHEQAAEWRRYSTLRADGGRATRSQFLADSYSVQALHARNDWMIRDADAVVAVADPEKTTGGTASTLAKIGESLPVIYLNIRDWTVKLRFSEVAGAGGGA